MFRRHLQRASLATVGAFVVAFAGFSLSGCAGTPFAADVTAVAADVTTIDTALQPFVGLLDTVPGAGAVAGSVVAAEPTIAKLVTSLVNSPTPTSAQAAVSGIETALATITADAKLVPGGLPANAQAVLTDLGTVLAAAQAELAGTASADPKVDAARGHLKALAAGGKH